jgi:hypothetical protein
MSNFGWSVCVLCEWCTPETVSGSSSLGGFQT